MFFAYCVFKLELIFVGLDFCGGACNVNSGGGVQGGYVMFLSQRVSDRTYINFKHHGVDPFDRPKCTGHFTDVDHCGVKLKST